MTQIQTLGSNAKTAEYTLAASPAKQRSDALRSMSASIDHARAQILKANGEDVAAAKESGMSEALIDRLTLNDARIDSIVKSILEIESFADPLGVIISHDERDNGLVIDKVSVPIGVIAVIFESRPNVSADSAALCVKSGNAVILRGGKESIRSNSAICEAMRSALWSVGLPMDCIQLVTDTTRESANELMKLNEYVDVLIPRGGAGLIRSVVASATVPVIQTGAGTCHVYVDKDADLEMAARVLCNAKVSRPSVCNSCECALVHSDVAERFLPMMKAALDEYSVEIRADERAFALLPGCVQAKPDDWGREYNDFILALHIVDSAMEAVEFINTYGTKHSEAIITKNDESAAYFAQNVDAAAVYINASTRFTDGGVFGLGAEIGISTQKLHARGPLGVRELTSYKYVIHGSGNIR